MAIELKRPSLTLEEFMALQEPEEGDVRGYEYEDGRLIPMPPVYVPQSGAWAICLGNSASMLSSTSSAGSGWM